MGLLRLLILFLIICYDTLIKAGKTECLDVIEYKKVRDSFHSTSSSVGVVNWAIIGLAFRFEPGTSKRNQLLANVIKRFSPPSFEARNITIIIFSEKTFSPEQMTHWRNQFNDTAHFQFIDTKRNRNPYPHKPFGYEYMCKFFTIDMYEYLKPYDYYIRLDTDCLILSLEYNIFDWVEKNHLEYAWATSGMESHGPTLSSLPQWVRNYSDAYLIRPSQLMGRPLSDAMHFYNNFHVGSVPFFFRQDVQNFLACARESPFFYDHRWGDAVVQVGLERPTYITIVYFDLHYFGIYRYSFLSPFLP